MPRLKHTITIAHSIPTPNSDTSSIRAGPLDLIRVQCPTRVDCASFWSQFILSWNGHIKSNPISIVFFAHRYIDRKYGHKLLSVIGVGWPDYGECDDQDRISFLRSHLRECIKAITHDKVNLYGFTGTKVVTVDEDHQNDLSATQFYIFISVSQLIRSSTIGSMPAVSQLRSDWFM